MAYYRVPGMGKKRETMRPMAKSILLPHPNGTAATESWLMVSMPACPEFPDFLIFQKMMQFRDLYKNLSIFILFCQPYQRRNCCCPIAIPDALNHLPLPFAKANKARYSLPQTPCC